MNVVIFFTIMFLSFNLYAEEIKCPKDNMLADFVLSFSSERMQVCQKKVDGKYIKDGPEIIYNADGTIKSKKYYKLDVESEESTEVAITPTQENTKKCADEAALVGNNCVPKSGIVWIGRYSCPGFQGETELLLTMGLDDVHATFSFTAKNGHGKYFMRGKYEPEKNLLTLEPVEWIIKPKNYVMVGMSGTINFEEHTFKGKISGCATFDLKVL